MRRSSLLLLLLLFSLRELYAQTSIAKLEKEVVTYIDKNTSRFTGLSDSIWEYAEPSFKEFKSTQLLSDFLQREGFSIKQNISSFPTVFIASYGADKPIIGLYGEYDADPGASNKTVPYREELIKGGYGHGGAHNLLGVGSIAAAVAIKELIKKGKLKGTIRYYGSTAEGTLGTRAWLAKDGYFNDLDLSLYWHPAPVTAAATSTWDALIDFTISFSSKRMDIVRDNIVAANCQRAAEILLGVVHRLKQSANETIKLNYSIKEWKNDLGHTPDTVILDFRIQCAKQVDAIQLYNDINKAVKDLNDSTVKAELKINRAHHQFLPNVTAMKEVFSKMELLGPIKYTTDEINYSLQMQDFLKRKKDTIADKLIPFNDASRNNKMYGYSSDIGEASWFAPEVYFVVRSFPNGVNMHQWQGAAFTAQSIGHKGMIQASKIMALTILDYIQNPVLRTDIRREFEENTKVYKYQPLIK
jgi:aminobenzoyl-glutamate utilization protein B